MITTLFYFCQRPHSPLPLISYGQSMFRQSAHIRLVKICPSLPCREVATSFGNTSKVQNINDTANL